ncbi:MAG: hypothetical protein N3F05_00665 [Candidatus Diapherotrites archaeon]|nr:hypothetical protein [Candidatus Diapherotrites archaeon]
MKSKGQSTIVSAVLYTLISLVVVSLILQVGLPYLTKIKEYNELKQAEATMKNIDSVISMVSSEGEGSKRLLTINLSDALDINSASDMIFSEKKTIADIISPRRKKSEGNFFIGANLSVNAYESKINDVNVFIMENEHLLFAVRKLDRNTPIKLDELVYQIRRIDTNEIFQGKLDFYLDNYIGSTVDVSTEFIESGYNIGKAHIVANVYGSAYSYKINFILESGFDFVRIYMGDLNV